MPNRFITILTYRQKKVVGRHISFAVSVQSFAIPLKTTLVPSVVIMDGSFSYLLYNIPLYVFCELLL